MNYQSRWYNSRIIDIKPICGLAMMHVYLCSLLLLLASCTPHSPAEELLDDYLTRLARVLDQPKPEIVRQPPTRLPAARELRVIIEPLSVDLLEYWAFRECGLAPLLGERNSVLGRVMPPSQALYMDGRLLRQLAHCQTVLQDQDMQALTHQLIEQKSAQWPLRYWNATVAAPEMRQFWSPSTEPLVPGQEESYRTAEAALIFLIRLPQHLYTDVWPDILTLELHYQQLESYQLGGKLLQSLQLGSEYLVSANRMLDLAIAKNTLCPYQLQRRELTYARNVMTHVFAGQVQPWFAILNRHANDILSSYDRLIGAQAEELKPRIEPYQKSLHQLFNNFKILNREHVERWQTLFENCGSKAIPDKDNSHIINRKS